MEEEFVVQDEVSGQLIGSFDCKEDAESFMSHVSSDVILSGGQPEFRVIPVSSPQNWVFDNEFDLERVN